MLDIEQVFPLRDKIIVKEVETKDIMKGGIILPGTAQEKSGECEVVRVNTENKLKLKKGDRIFYIKYSGVPLTIEGADYTVLAEEDIVAIIGKKE